MKVVHSVSDSKGDFMQVFKVNWETVSKFQFVDQQDNLCIWKHSGWVTQTLHWQEHSQSTSNKGGTGTSTLGPELRVGDIILVYHHPRKQMLVIIL